MDITPADRTASHEVWHRPFVKEHHQWCDDFVLELRLRDVFGPVIGERLAEVEAHCAETGETPFMAFGDPTDYAKQIDDHSAPGRVSGIWRTTVIGAAQVLALLVGTTAVAPWARSEQLSYNIVQVGCLALFLLLLLSLPKLVGPVMQLPWTVGLPLLALGPLLGVGLAASGGLDLPAVLTLPPAAIALGLFVVVVVLAFAEYRELSRDFNEDLVTSPLAPAPHAPEQPERPRGFALLTSSLIPVAYVAFSALGWIFA